MSNVSLLDLLNDSTIPHLNSREHGERAMVVDWFQQVMLILDQLPGIQFCGARTEHAQKQLPNGQLAVDTSVRFKVLVISYDEQRFELQEGASLEGADLPDGLLKAISKPLPLNA